MTINSNRPPKTFSFLTEGFPSIKLFSHTVGLPRNGGNVLNTYIKDNLNSSFNDLKFMTSGTITVGTSGGQRTFSFEVRIVNDLISQYDAEAEGIPLTGSVILPLEVFN